MEVKLFKYERQSIETLREMYALDDKLVTALILLLNRFAILHGQTIAGSQNRFQAGRVVILGLINHVHHLLNGGLQALTVGNGHVWSACVRGLMETFGGCVMISERPGIIPNFLTHVKAGQLRAAAERGSPGLGADIDRLNQIVHPVSGAIYANYRIADEQSHTVRIRFGFSIPEHEDGREGVIVLANLATLLHDKFEALLARPEVMQAGELIMVKDNQEPAGA